MDLAKALAFAGRKQQGVLTTIKRDGRPQLSNVIYELADNAFKISITADRAKYHNLVRDPWAALHVTRSDFFAYAVFEGEAKLSAIAADPHDDVVEQLVATYRAMSGEHPDWDEYRAAMVKDRRLVVTFRASRAYGQLFD